MARSTQVVLFAGVLLATTLATTAEAQRTLISVRSILDLGDRVVEDVQWSAGDFDPLAAVAENPAEPPARRVVAIVVLAEHFSHQTGELFTSIACEASDARVIAAALTARGEPIDTYDPSLPDARDRACAPRAQPREHPSDTRLAIGGTFEPALSYDEDTGLAILGIGLSARFGVRFPNHLAILVHFGAQAQTALGDSIRTYLGLGPSLMFDIGIPFNEESALHLGIGHGFDYGESIVDDGFERRGISGVFPTLDLYGISVLETAFSVGLHLHVAIPTDAPDLFAITGALMFGGETL
ncbi:MAG: hypothetical protein R3B82_13985 [Sandaracinaceae bacterium]